MVYGVGLFLGLDSLWSAGQGGSTCGWPTGATTASGIAEAAKGNDGVDGVRAMVVRSEADAGDAAAGCLPASAHCRKSMLSPAAQPFSLQHASPLSLSSSWSSGTGVSYSYSPRAVGGATTAACDELALAQRPCPAHDSHAVGARGGAYAGSEYSTEAARPPQCKPKAKGKHSHRQQAASTASELVRTGSSATDSSGSERGSSDGTHMSKDVRKALLQAASVVYLEEGPQQVVRRAAAAAAVSATNGPLGPCSIAESALVARVTQVAGKAWMALPMLQGSRMASAFEPSDGILRVVPWRTGQQVLMLDVVDLLFQLAWMAFPGHDPADEARRALVHVLARARSGPAGPFSLSLNQVHERLATELPPAAAVLLSQNLGWEVEQLGMGCVSLVASREAQHGGCSVRLCVHTLADWAAACQVASHLTPGVSMSATQVHMDRLVLCVASLVCWGPKPSALLGAGLALAAEYPWFQVMGPQGLADGACKMEYVAKMMDHCCRSHAPGSAAAAMPAMPNKAALQRVLQQEPLFAVDGSGFVRLDVGGLCARVVGAEATASGAGSCEEGSSTAAVMHAAIDTAAVQLDLDPAHEAGGSAQRTGVQWPPDVSCLRVEMYGLQLRGLLHDIRTALGSGAREDILAGWLARMRDLAAARWQLPHTL